MAQENLATFWESMTKVMRNDCSKGSEKGRERGKKGKGNKEKTRNQLQIPVSKATAEHVENGDTRRVSVGKDTCMLWRKFRVLLRVQLHQAQPAKTAALIQEFNVEQGTGWIFGVMGGSVASVTTGSDNLWDELVLDSG